MKTKVPKIKVKIETNKNYKIEKQSTKQQHSKNYNDYAKELKLIKKTTNI